MTLSISGKTAIVTGAAHGIGLAIARHLLDRGAQVMFADIDEARLADELGDDAKSDGPARYFAGDLCQKLCVKNLLSATVDAFERIDILVNAARCIKPADPLDTDQTVLDEMLQLNMKGMLRLSQMTANRMIKQAEDEGNKTGEAGCIVNISTPPAACAHPETMAYAIASAAQEQMTRSLALVLAPKHIRVNGVNFASVMSANLQNHLRDHPEWRGDLIKATPLGRIAPPSELAETVQFLASSGAGFVTGQIVTVDGGRGLGSAPRLLAF
ncbi:SDR family NAD(P)-dependent oxidoreductase [Pseudothioclava arenosa]|uniref:Oxidoreductase n=1 Tax=Pseudothioclava arenosa TaxID=1795308 RepID=A0A2A4CUW3_9RHOB|nr:SDR family oxidoreductase [Pseudothioclava arenosa]PCD78052.1 oxidoreductase [Pseudothioclava arenosa]